MASTHLPPYGTSPRRVGCNDPCPCGSGKKYKKFCAVNGRPVFIPFSVLSPPPASLSGKWAAGLGGEARALSPMTSRSIWENAMSDATDGLSTHTEAPAASRRGRDARRAARTQRSGVSIPYITRNLPLTEVLSEEAMQTIEHNAETLLEEIGIEFREYPR